MARGKEQGCGLQGGGGGGGEIRGEHMLKNRICS